MYAEEQKNIKKIFCLKKTKKHPKKKFLPKKKTV
jgi:hypothetical protein